MTTPAVKTMISKMVSYLDGNTEVPDDLKLEYSKAVEQSSNPFEKLDAERIRCHMLISEGNLPAALELIETILNKYALLPEAHKTWKNAIKTISNSLAKHALLSDNSQMLVATYERLNDIGEAGILNHARIIPHYLKIGDKENATRLIETMSQTAPNFPPLKTAIEELNGVDDVSKIKPTPSPIPVPILSLEEMEWILEMDQKVNSLWEQDKFQEMFLEASKVLEKYPTLNDITAPFYFAAMVGMDHTQKHLEALPIITELVQQFPHYPPFQSSYTIFFSRFTHKLGEKLETLSKAALVRYDEVFHQFFYTPLLILQRIAELEAQAGKPNSVTLQKIKTRISLSPNDPDFLRAEWEVAVTTKDPGELCLIKSRIQMLHEKRPFDMRYSKLMKLIGTGEPK